ncbi:DUF2254 domain-containing protein [Ponticaulis sp.]|uniref:DUF2254 domain-containing protein n=1 Tax=Ponticaulis sp. TaxID=2020902 RepID=UPI0025D90A94|nr:DUF2254 domain-containing protein [Ponticaulis sp.]
MKSFLLNALDDIRSSYWFIPTIMAILATLASFAMIEVDVVMNASGPDWLKWLFDNQPEGAREVLSTIAGSMITVAGVVFSITLVSVSNAAFQFGPRLLTTFMRDRANQITLGTFIATFLYCLMVLRAVQSAPQDASSETASAFVPHVALLGALILAICSIAVLIYFIHHVPQSIHVSRLLAGIGEEFANRVDTTFPAELGTPGPGFADTEIDTFRRPFETGSTTEDICAARAGYVRTIDGDTLLHLARTLNLHLILWVRPGDFVNAGERVMTLLPQADAPETSHIDQLRITVYLDDLRSPMQDIAFLAQELSEIAMRALSPGINDPVTAITAMDWLGAGLTRFGAAEPDCPLRADSDGTPRILAPATRFDGLLKESLGSILPFAARNLPAAKGFLQVLDRMERQLGEADSKALAALRKDMLAIARTELTAPEYATLES